jgi:glycosyltransferase involved in cell wall biosynthesis
MNSKLIFVTSYLPRECGIATFTNDLINAIKNQMDDSIEIEVCALENGHQGFDYPEEVKYVLDATKLEQYQEIAEKINEDYQVKTVMIEHEFGLFGGEWGDYLLNMVDVLVKPVFVTFHTVLPHPEKKIFQIFKNIADKAEKIVVMTNSSRQILIDDYKMHGDKIKVIPHGTHMILWKNNEKAKERFGISHRPIITNFGLLVRQKSIETAIDALPEIKELFPDVLYLVLGKTHPELKKIEGEKYRYFLEKKVKQLGLEENIQFVNKFLDLDELHDYLSITDIYLFTTKNRNQAVSGTFIYAMSSACPIIATSIPHAKELLSKDTGILVDFEQPQQIARATIRLLNDENLRKRMSKNAFYKTRYTIWENVANKIMELFRPFIEHSNYRYRIPPINLEHIKHLTTDRGIIRFSNFDIADLDSGYRLDDNARALIALGQHYELTKKPSDLKLINTYLDYIIYCQKSDGSFINYVDKDGSINIRNNTANLNDTNGMAIWALGFLLSQDNFNKLMLDKAEICMQKALTNVENIHSPRAIAFIIKGLYYYNLKKYDRKITTFIKVLADRLLEYFNKVADKNWHWFEEYLTYSNVLLPEAMLYAWKATGNICYHIIAKATFDFLLSKVFKDGCIKVISNDGWIRKTKKSQKGYDELPINVAYTIMSLDLFYSELGEPQYFTKLNIAFDWFMGLNHLNQIIYNPATGGCYDVLEKDGVNLNQGAESTTSYLLARMIMVKYYHVEKRKISKPLYHSEQLRNLLKNKNEKLTSV